MRPNSARRPAQPRTSLTWHVRGCAQIRTCVRLREQDCSVIADRPALPAGVGELPGFLRCVAHVVIAFSRHRGVAREQALWASAGESGTALSWGSRRTSDGFAVPIIDLARSPGDERVFPVLAEVRAVLAGVRIVADLRASLSAEGEVAQLPLRRIDDLVSGARTGAGSGLRRRRVPGTPGCCSAACLLLRARRRALLPHSADGRATPASRARAPRECTRSGGCRASLRLFPASRRSARPSRIARAGGRQD